MAERKLAGHTQRNIRSSNLHVVLSMFRSSGTLTIRDITERTGLSKTAVSKIVNELLSRGLVLPAGKGTSTEGGGKRPDLFELSTKNTFAITATFLPKLITVSLYDASLVLLDSERRQPSDCDPTPYFNCDLTTADQRQKTPQEHFEYDAAISVLAGLIQRIMVKNHLTPAQVAGITISVVGIVSSETGTLVTTLISKDWPDELPVVRDLRQHLPFPCSIYLDNISRVGAYAHLWEKPQRYQQNIVVLYCDNSVGGAMATLSTVSAASLVNSDISQPIILLNRSVPAESPAALKASLPAMPLSPVFAASLPTGRNPASMPVLMRRMSPLPSFFRPPTTAIPSPVFRSTSSHDNSQS